MSGIDELAADLRDELSRARRDLGLPEIDPATPEELLADAGRLSEVVGTRMRTIEEQLDTLQTTRRAARGYLAGESTLPR